MLRFDTYDQPQAPDPVLDQGTVLAIARRYAPRASEVTAVDESGGEARAYAIDDSIVLKTQRPHRLRPRTSLEKEVFFLNALAAEPEIVVPKVLGYGKESGVEYICMTRVPGVAARSVTLEGIRRTEVMRDLGRTLRRVHSLPQGQFRESSLFPGFRTYEEFVQQVEAGLHQAVSVIRADPTLWTLPVSPSRVAESAIAGMPKAVDLVALHSNPGPEHTFLDPETMQFKGIIDFGDAFISHPSLDWRWPRHEDRVSILDGYRAEESLPDSFLAAWRGCLVLSDMLAIATRPQRRQDAMVSLRALLREL